MTTSILESVRRLAPAIFATVVLAASAPAALAGGAAPRDVDRERRVDLHGNDRWGDQRGDDRRGDPRQDDRRGDARQDDRRGDARQDDRWGDASSDDRWDDRGRGGRRGDDRFGAVLPAGTRLLVELDRGVGTDRSRVGDRVSARLSDDVVVGRRVMLPAGTRVLGEVVESQRAGRFGRSRLSLAFDRAVLRDGTSLDIDAGVTSLGRGSAGRQASLIAGSSIGGAILGKALGGDDRDAFFGAIVGGGIAAGAIASRPGQPVMLPAGTVLCVELDQATRLPSRW
jgi:type IV secretory pathway VirB10-like protein